MGLGKLESFLEDHIEGFFNKRFASALEPVELMKGLEKEIARQGRGKAEHTVPNNYVFSLAEADYQRFCAKRVSDELYLWIEKQVVLQNYVMTGKLKLDFVSDSKRTRGTYALKATFTTDEANDCEDQMQTMVLERPKFGGGPLNLPTEYKIASLKVIAGVDKDAYLEIGERKIYIGRRDKNEFILTDSKASRLHAWLAYENHRHVLYDAQSTNGTYVNDKLVQTCCLKSGDKIGIGSTVLLYEVI